MLRVTLETRTDKRRREDSLEMSRENAVRLRDALAAAIESYDAEPKLNEFGAVTADFR
jgi:hypothetical protein